MDSLDLPPVGSYPICAAFVSFVLSGPYHGAATLLGDPIASGLCDGRVGQVIVSPAGSSSRLTVLMQLTVAQSLHWGSQWTVAELYLKVRATRAPETCPATEKDYLWRSDA